MADCRVEERQAVCSVSDTPDMWQSAKLRILALLVLRLGMVALTALSVCIAISSHHDGGIVKFGSGASK